MIDPLGRITFNHQKLFFSGILYVICTLFQKSASMFVVDDCLNIFRLKEGDVSLPCCDLSCI